MQVVNGQQLSESLRRGLSVLIFEVERKGRIHRALNNDLQDIFCLPVDLKAIRRLRPPHPKRYRPL